MTLRASHTLKPAGGTLNDDYKLIIREYEIK